MARYFYIQLTGGTSSGPYSIYYNNVTTGNLATLFPSGLPASGITLSDLTLSPGIQVEIPDDATSIIIYNEKCDTTQIIDIGQGVTGTCICLTIIPISGQQGESITQILFCPNGFEQNGKPVYEGTLSGVTYELSWKGNFWEINGIPFIDGPIRSFSSSNIPLTGWQVYGECGDGYIIRGDLGECPDVTTINYINCSHTNPLCLGDNGGTITAYAIGGTGGWLYSLDGIYYNNALGVFTGLYAGSYTVYAKDSSGTIITCSALLEAPYSNTYPLVINVTTPERLIGTSLNYKIYRLDFEIDTSGLMSGVSVRFNFDVDYILSYVGPGSAFFDTAYHEISVNGIPVSMSLTSSVPIAQNGQSSCDATYNSYMGHNEYQSSTITATNTDTIIGHIIYSIDTDSAGQFINSCITTATVKIVATLKNARINTDCDSLSVISLDYSRVQTFIGGQVIIPPTTAAPISTTTLPPCAQYLWITTISASTLTYTDCNGITQTLPCATDSNGYICVLNGTTPIFNPTIGTTLTNTYNPCTSPVVTTTFSTSPDCGCWKVSRVSSITCPSPPSFPIGLYLTNCQTKLQETVNIVIDDQQFCSSTQPYITGQIASCFNITYVGPCTSSCATVIPTTTQLITTTTTIPANSFIGEWIFRNETNYPPNYEISSNITINGVLINTVGRSFPILAQAGGIPTPLEERFNPIKTFSNGYYPCTPSTNVSIRLFFPTPAYVPSTETYVRLYINSAYQTLLTIPNPNSLGGLTYFDANFTNLSIPCGAQVKFVYSSVPPPTTINPGGGGSGGNG